MPAIENVRQLPFNDLQTKVKSLKMYTAEFDGTCTMIKIPGLFCIAANLFFRC
jgi:hypothetical protein